MPWSNLAHVPQVLSLGSSAKGPQLLSHILKLLKPEDPSARDLQREKPAQ